VVTDGLQVYLPLFIDIHQDILHNPLDFSRHR
jgi:hypothetical protein